MKYEIGKVYDFDGQQRKVIGFSGGYPVTSLELDCEVSTREASAVDVDAIRAEIAAECKMEAKQFGSGLLSVFPFDKCTKEELLAVASYIGLEIVGAEEIPKADIIAHILND